MPGVLLNQSVGCDGQRVCNRRIGALFWLSEFVGTGTENDWQQHRVEADQTGARGFLGRVWVNIEILVSWDLEPPGDGSSYKVDLYDGAGNFVSNVWTWDSGKGFFDSETIDVDVSTFDVCGGYLKSSISADANNSDSVTVRVTAMETS